jgi:hypothetical protein
MTITVDTANAAMALMGGILSFLAAVLTLMVVLLPKEEAAQTVRTMAARALSATPQALSLIGVMTFTFLDSQRIGLMIFGIALILLFIQFLRRPGPAARIEIFAIVFQSCMFSTLTVMYLLSRVTGIIESLIKVLNK